MGCANIFFSNIIISSDYSSYELGILAEIARDNKLKLDLLNTDFYAYLGSIILQQKINKYVNSFFRLKIKIIIFSVIYGMNLINLSNKINISIGTSKYIKNKFLNLYKFLNIYFFEIKKTHKKK